MTYVITDPCIGTKDKSCVEVCPVDCIYEPGEDAPMLYIHPDECIDCGACEPVCPVSAIYTEEDVPDDQAAYIEINALYPEEPQAAAARVAELNPETRE